MLDTTWKNHLAFYGVDDTEAIEKTITTSTTGAVNTLFGPFAWSQMNTASNAFASLPKAQHQEGAGTGWRVRTSFADTGKGGVAEDGSIPSGVDPNLDEIDPGIKTTAVSFDITEQAQLRSVFDDAINKDEERSFYAIEHSKQVERAILEDPGTAVGNNMESLDRIVSSGSEESGKFSAGDCDLWGIDRSTDSWADAQVDHNSGTNRTFELSYIRDTIRDVHAAGGNPQYILTGYDTWGEIANRVDPQGRFDVSQAGNQIDVEDAETLEGMGYNSFVAEYQGLPIIVSDQVQTDGVSRLFVLDTSNPEAQNKPRLGVDVSKPTQYAEAGVSNNMPQIVDGFQDQGVYWTNQELGCRSFAKQGKVTDLKA